MTTTELTETARPAPWYDRLSDWFNAILVKEARQSLKSRQFIANFMLMLAAAWAGSVFGLLNAGEALEFGAVGRQFFYFFYVVLAFAAVFIVPFAAFRSLLNERDLKTYDLLSITSLSPRQIVWGKLLSAAVQLFLFYSAITPFMAFASLMQGFNAVSAAFILTATMLYSLLLSMTALMLATFARHRILSGLVTLVLLAGLGIGYIYTIVGVGLLLALDALAVSSPEFWWVVGFVIAVAASYFILFQQIATSQLTFESDNRSSRIRIVCVGQFWLLWIAYAAASYFGVMPYSPEILQTLAGISIVHWVLAGLIFSTEGDHLSRRVRRGIPRNRLLRWLAAPLFPGGARGYCFTLLHLGIVWGMVVIVQGLDVPRPVGLSVADYYGGLTDLQSQSWSPTLRITTAWCCYAAVYLGIGTAMARWGRLASSDVRAVHVRILTVLVVIAGIILPLLTRLTELVESRTFTVYDITSPPYAWWELSRRTPSDRLRLEFPCRFAAGIDPRSRARRRHRGDAARGSGRGHPHQRAGAVARFHVAGSAAEAHAVIVDFRAAVG